ncbi:hypothetical protein TSOC_015430, partial [Tetrabaena socialis]
MGISRSASTCIAYLMRKQRISFVQAAVQDYDKYDDVHQKFWAALRVVADAELEEAAK